MSSAAPSSNRRLFVLYIAAVCFYWAALYLYVPTLSVYVESKAETLASVGVVLSMYGLWQAVIRLPLGIAADWVGRRKPFMIVGFGLAGLGAMTMGIANGIPGLTLGRALTGFAAGSWVLLVVAFSALFPPEDAVRASAILSAINSVARMAATGVTGTLNALGGYPLAFYVAAVMAALAMVSMMLVREPRREAKQPTLRQLGTLITRRDVLLPSLLGIVAQYAIWASTFGFATNLAKNLGASDVTLSLLISMNIGLVFLGNLAMSIVARRVSSRWMVALSFIFVALGLGALAVAKGMPMIFAGQILMGLASGVGYPVMMGLSIRYVEDGQRATAMGLYQAVYAIGMFAGPWLSGILADVMGIQPMFGITAAVCLVLGLGGTSLLAAKD
ncbi:MAG: MFS transporter [Anaerolineae bacterium]|jgi:MFS family permease|nr:MFS transporter [Anaerolineae bacterium]